MKKIMSYAMIFMMSLMMLCAPSYQTYAADLSMSVSSSNVNIGDTITVTVTAPSGTTATVDVYFPTDIFEFGGATGTSNTSGGTVTTTLGEPFSSSFTVTLKAKTSGTATISAKAIKAGDSVTGEVVTVGSASKTVTVSNQTPSNPGNGETTAPQLSADNSLSSLKLSNATLSPSFKRNVTKYTATVAYDITKVVVSAKTSNNKAVIESVTDDGTVNLNVGENTIKIVVRAENGVKATYTIVVTRKAQETTPVNPPEGDTPPASEITPPEVNEMLQWNGEQLQVVETIPTESIPANFESTLLVVNGQQMQGLSFTKGDLKVLYLNNTNGAGSLYVYDEVQQTIYPFIKLISEKGYVIVLLPDEQNEPAPEGFESCTLSIEGKGIVSAYQLKAGDFYLMYCMNDAGEKGWYMYDSVEGTYQRYFTMTPSVETGGDVADTDLESKYAALEKELNTAKMTQYIILAIAAAVIFILIILIIVLAVKRRKKDEDLSKGYEENQNEECEEQDVQEAVVTEEILAIEEALAIEETLAIEENDDELEIEFYEIEAPVEESEEVDDDEIEIEFYEMEAPVEEPEEVEVEEDGELEIEFYEMETPVENQEEVEVKDETEFLDLENAIVSAIEEAKKEVEPAQEPEIKIVRKPRTVDLTSKLSSKKEADDDDLEFIDFE